MTYTDLSGILYIQQQYLTDLSALSANADVSAYVNDLQNQLNNSYSIYSNASQSSAAVLDHQADMNKIIQAESDRLNMKKQNVDSALYGQQRMIAFNESYRKKYVMQIYILITIVLVLVVYLGLILLEKNIPFIPGFLIGILKIVDIVIGFVVILVLLLQINKRDKMDFDKLVLSTPTSGNLYINGNTTTTGNITANSITATVNCIASDCCAAGTTWSDSDGQCLVSKTSAASSPATAPATAPATVQGFSNIAEPYTNYEFSYYGEYSK